MSTKTETKPAKTMMAMREIHWKCLVLGSSYPEDFDKGKWMSPLGENFPLDIVLGLDNITNVYKVILEVDDDKIPSRVDVTIGLSDVRLPISYKSAREANFDRPVRMEYRKRDRGQARMESKSAFTDTIGQYVWLQISGALQSSENPSKQIGLSKVTVLGYPLNEDEINVILKNQRDDFMDYRPQSGSSVRGLELPPDRAPSRGNQKESKKKVERYSYNGDGMTTSGSRLAQDPLTCIRTVKRAIEQKKDDAKAIGKDVEATVCLRALQRLTEYEAMLEDLSSRRSNALIHEEFDQAERLRQTMADCRDTALRSSHIDLLFDRTELRAVGVTSDWTQQA